MAQDHREHVAVEVPRLKVFPRPVMDDLDDVLRVATLSLSLSFSVSPRLGLEGCQAHQDVTRFSIVPKLTQTFRPASVHAKGENFVL